MQRKHWYLTVGVGAPVMAVAVGISWMMFSMRPGSEHDGSTSHASGSTAEGAPAKPTVSLDGPTAAFVLEPLFDTLDCDRKDAIDDGQIDEHFSQLFAPMDLDQSRSLTLSEFVRSSRTNARPRQEAVFSLADRNGDGLVSALEYGEFLVTMIGLADTDKDGDVTRVELLSHLPTKAPVQLVNNGAREE